MFCRLVGRIINSTQEEQDEKRDLLLKEFLDGQGSLIY